MGTVLQYTLVYCSEKGMRKAVSIAIQTGCVGRGAGQAEARGRRRRNAGAGRWARAGAGREGASVRHKQARGACEARRHEARGLGVLLGQQAVHLVHSACF